MCPVMCPFVTDEYRVIWLKGYHNAIRNVGWTGWKKICPTDEDEKNYGAYAIMYNTNDEPLDWIQRTDYEPRL